MDHKHHNGAFTTTHEAQGISNGMAESVVKTAKSLANKLEIMLETWDNLSWATATHHGR